MRAGLSGAHGGGLVTAGPCIPKGIYGELPAFPALRITRFTFTCTFMEFVHGLWDRGGCVMHYLLRTGRDTDEFVISLLFNTSVADRFVRWRQQPREAFAV